MKQFAHILSRLSLLALMVLALVALPFVHRAGAAPVTPEMSRFIAMGGNLSDICGESGGHSAGGCESCTVVGSALLSTLMLPQRPAFNLTMLSVNPVRAQTALPATPHTNPPVRAPPHF
ncbi:hypothetical protein [Sulfitobacter sp.]|uniref:hypothetical protein n=1 Tax=Sulfitobacter sp. TaxID=1903071 RepID=UPI00300302C2